MSRQLPLVALLLAACEGPSSDLVEAAPAAASARVVGTVQTLRVPTDVPTVEAALAVAANHTFGPNGSLAIVVESPGLVVGAPIRFTHAQGDRISLVGETGDPADTTLQFAGAGLVVDAGNRLGRVDGLTILGTGAGDGVTASRGAFVGLGADLVIEGFQRGLFVAGNSTADASGVEIRGAAAHGVEIQSSFANLDLAWIHDNEAAGVAMIGGTASLVQADVELNGAGTGLAHTYPGLTAGHNATVLAGGARFADNASDGLECALGSWVYLVDADVTGNGGAGLVGRQACDAFGAPFGNPAARITTNGSAAVDAAGGGTIDVDGADLGGQCVNAVQGATVFADTATCGADDDTPHGLLP